MMTREQKTERLLARILDIDGNNGAKECIKEYYEDLYSFDNMKDVSVYSMRDGEVVKHSYLEGPVLHPPELSFVGKGSAKLVLDKALKCIDALRDEGCKEIIVGIRSKVIEQIAFVPPDMYFGYFSFSGVTKDEVYWYINDGKGTPAVVDQSMTKKAA